ncbi:hypothetical protein B0H14DRAFT_2628557 [Mycena olivaceomarginata]|nr:hypothetical protein B0H14DRAFT_2628557 [Mycena olivaceomarginata]
MSMAASLSLLEKNKDRAFEIHTFVKLLDLEWNSGHDCAAELSKMIWKVTGFRFNVFLQRINCPPGARVVLGKHFAGDLQHCVWWESHAEQKVRSLGRKGDWLDAVQLGEPTQTLRLHVGNHDRELPRTQHKQYTVCLEPAKILKVDLYDPLKRPSRPSFDGPFLEGKNGRRDGHGTRSTGAVEPSRRQRAAALHGYPGSLRNSMGLTTVGFQWAASGYQ